MTSDEEYRQVDSVGSLFDYSRRLLNPEIILRRLYDYQDQRIFEPAMQGIRRILELRDDHRIEFRKGGGVQISGPGVGQTIPLDAWADGYRLTFSWILDLYGRAMQAGAITDSGGIRGVLLVDEIEKRSFGGCSLDPRYFLPFRIGSPGRVPGIEILPRHAVRCSLMKPRRGCRTIGAESSGG